MKSILLFLVIAVTVLPAGERDLKEIEKLYVYDFIRMDANHITPIENLGGMQHYFEELHALEKQNDRQVQVLHIGDSHIQADFFSGKMRELYYQDERFPMASRGFAFPYRLAKTNNPMNYTVSYRGAWTGKKCSSNKHKSQFGLAGITAYTNVSSSYFTINPNLEGKENYKLNRVKVFYPTSDPYSMEPRISLDNGKVLAPRFIQDGFAQFILPEEQEKVKIILHQEKKTNNRFLLQGVSLESDYSGLVYSASGVNGAKVKSYAKCVDFNKHIHTLDPDLVIISLGTNDAYYSPFSVAEYKQQYRQMIQGIREAVPEVSILLTTAGDNYRSRKYLNRNNLEVRKAIFDLAKEEKVAVWDFFTVMGGLNAITHWKSKGMAQADMIHLTQEGYEYQGKLLYKAIDDAYRMYQYQLGDHER